jgi:hypothetical protein
METVHIDSDRGPNIPGGRWKRQALHRQSGLGLTGTNGSPPLMSFEPYGYPVGLGTPTSSQQRRDCDRTRHTETGEPVVGLSEGNSGVDGSVDTSLKSS